MVTNGMTIDQTLGEHNVVVETYFVGIFPSSNQILNRNIIKLNEFNQKIQ